jgi:hypothetical protein
MNKNHTGTRKCHNVETTGPINTIGLRRHVNILTYLLRVLRTVCTKWTHIWLVVSVRIFQLGNGYTKFYEIWYEHYATRGYPKAVPSNLL